MKWLEQLADAPIQPAGFLSLPVVAFLLFPVMTTLNVPEAPAHLADESHLVVIDLDHQFLYTFEQGQLRSRHRVVTGRSENPTPTGEFSIAWKSADYHSREYDVPMPHSMFFVPERGIAIHGSEYIHWRRLYNGIRSGNPVGSGACVGLTANEAQALFDWAPVGTPVIVQSVDS